MNKADRQAVRDRAGDRCEYCLLRQEHFAAYRHQIEHIVPRKHGGDDSLQNLALACIRCNLGKGPNLTGIDQQTGEVVELFHPRRDDWNEHFTIRDAEIVGQTPCGRATVGVLNMNEEPRLLLRRELIRNGELDSME